MQKRISNYTAVFVAVVATLAGCTRPVADKPLAKSPSQPLTQAVEPADAPPATAEQFAEASVAVAEPASKLPTDTEVAAPEAERAKAEPENAKTSDEAIAPQETEQAHDTAKPDSLEKVELAEAEIIANVAKTRIAKVELTETHKALCKVAVGDQMPTIEAANLEGQMTSLSSLYGPKASVIVFFDHRKALSRMQLADVTPDIVERFSNRGVRAVVVAVNQTADQAQQSLAEAKAQVPTLVDPEGAAFAAVGSERLPRTYVLDSSGKIVWFDIEYSRSTRREMLGALAHLLVEPEHRDASATETQPTATTAKSPRSDSKPM